MEKIYISESGPEVSAAIYSFWRWTSEALAKPKKVEEIINYNLELGVNTFDHSNSYADGKIETYFGNAIAAKSFKREDIIISTKGGLEKFTNSKQKGYYVDLSSTNIEKSVNASLKRLKTDYIDIYLLEQSDFLYNAEETASTLTKLILSGKIVHIGVSNFNVFQHRLLASYLPKPIVTNHIELSLLNTNSLNDGRLDFIKEQYSKPMASAPLAGGKILNSKDTKTIALRKLLNQIGKKHNANAEQIAVAWIYKLGALPIIGSPDKSRIKNAASAYKINLSHQDWYLLYNATKK